MKEKVNSIESDSQIYAAIEPVDHNEGRGPVVLDTDCLKFLQAF